MAEKRYVNGIFIKATQTQYGELINLSIHVDNFTKELIELAGDQDYVRLTLGKRKEKDKNGNTHFCFLNDFVPEKKQETAEVKKPEDLDLTHDPLPF